MECSYLSSYMYGVNISQLIRFARVCTHVDDFNNRNLFLTAKLLKQGCIYHILVIRKAFFFKFYHRHLELIVKYNVWFTNSSATEPEPIFYGDFRYNFKRIVGKPHFSDQFKNIFKCYKKVGYKVRKMAKIRNQYNPAPHLTQDTNGKVTTSQLDITNESLDVSPFPASDHKASITWK